MPVTKGEIFMEYILVAFSSRVDTIKFNEFLNRNGISGQIVNTIKQANVGCGLSVKTSVNNYNLIKKALTITNLKSFAGCFLVKNTFGKITVKSI